MPQQQVEQTPVGQSAQQSVEQSPRQPIKQSPRQPIQLSHYQSSKCLLKQSYQPIPTNQPQVLGTTETCSRRNSTDSINYCCNSEQESRNSNSIEVVITQVIKISNITDMNIYYHTSHNTNYFIQ